MKKCNKCNKDKQLIEFYKETDRHNKERYRKSCKECEKSRQQKYRLNNPDKVKNACKVWYDKIGKFDKVTLKNKQLKRYKIDIDQYNQMFTDQEGKCSICKVHRSELIKDLSVDHCHETGEIRGLLCNPCNTAIGLFKDNVASLNSAIAYLTKKDR